MPTELGNRFGNLTRRKFVTLAVGAGTAALTLPILDQGSIRVGPAIAHAQPVTPVTTPDLVTPDAPTMSIAEQLARHIYKNYGEETLGHSDDTPFESCAYAIRASILDNDGTQTSASLINNAYKVQEWIFNHVNQPIDDDLGVGSLELFGQLYSGKGASYETLIITFDPGMVRRQEYIWLDDPSLWNDPDAPDMVKIGLDDPEFNEKYKKYLDDPEFIKIYEKYLAKYNSKLFNYKVPESFGYELNPQIARELSFVRNSLQNPEQFGLITNGQSPYKHKECEYLSFIYLPKPLEETAISAESVAQRVKNDLVVKPVLN